MYERAALVANTVGEDSGYLGLGGGMWVAGCWQVEPWGITRGGKRV